MQHALLDSAQRAPLEPDDSVANVRHGLTLAGVFHGVKARVLAHWHVAQNLAALAPSLTTQPGDPADSLGGWIPAHSVPFAPTLSARRLVN